LNLDEKWRKLAKPRDVSGIDENTAFRVAIGALIESRFDHMMKYQDGTIDGRDPEDLHQMRVGSRRLRAAMDVGEFCFPKRFRYFHRRVKQLTDALGEARDCDVMREALTAYRDSRPDEERQAINSMLKEIAEQRERARDEMIQFFDVLEVERFEVRFRGFFAEHSLG
jgi:CHAD domain-containing protein